MASQPQPPRVQEKKISMALIFAIVCVASIPRATADVSSAVEGENHVNVSLHMKLNPNSQPQANKAPQPTALPQTTAKPSFSIDLDVNADDKKMPAESKKSSRLQTLIDKFTESLAAANLAPDVENKSAEVATVNRDTLLDKFVKALNANPFVVVPPITKEQKIQGKLKKIENILESQVRKLKKIRAQLNPAVPEADEESETPATTPLPLTMAKTISAMLEKLEGQTSTR